MKLRLHKHRHAKNSWRLTVMWDFRDFLLLRIWPKGLFARLWYTIFVNMCHFIYGKKQLDIS